MESKKLKPAENEYMTEAEEVGSVSSILSKVETVGFQGLGSTTEMEKKLKEYTEKRDVILKWIDENFEEGVDYGWTDERSLDKKTLKKPGAEKLCRVFDTHPRWIRDYESWEMFGKPAGTGFMICQIVDNKTQKVIGEGRGASTIGQKGRDANKAVKNLEKCAIVDAALYTFMMSEFFTQDDGGKNQATLAKLKVNFAAKVADLRVGTQSSVTDHMWIHIVIKDFLHKNLISSEGEMIKISQAIFKKNMYDLSTGERQENPDIETATPVNAQEEEPLTKEEKVMVQWCEFIDNYFEMNPNATAEEIDASRIAINDKAKGSADIMKYFDDAAKKFRDNA